MSITEDNIIILLRKIEALALPKIFEATEDTYREVILNKLEDNAFDLFTACDNFILELDILSKLTNSEGDKLSSLQEQENITNSIFAYKEELKKECKKNHINIDYELHKLFE